MIFLTTKTRDVEPQCVPLADAVEYGFDPEPLKPLPPMPFEVSIHYLEHGDKDHLYKSMIWGRRLPRRRTKRIIPTYGWGHTYHRRAKQGGRVLVVDVDGISEYLHGFGVDRCET